MISLFTFTTEPGPCEYLPDREWSLRYEVVGELTPAEYMQRMKAGWRRFGYSLFRPVCPACKMCQSLRVPVATFKPDRSQRRALAANDGEVRLAIGQPSADSEKFDLYDRYHHFQRDSKGWPGHGPTNEVDYGESFVENPFPTEEWCYYLGDRLVGVGYVDALPEGLSAIYFFYDPDVRDRSLGTYNVLSIIREAAVRGIPHVYLGYYVEGCQSLEYKARFRPNEVLGAGGVWIPWRAPTRRCCMLFSWLARHRRAKLLATPFPDEWLGYLERNVTLYTRLNARERAKLRDDLRVLVAEKHWEGCGGLVMTDEVKVTIAAHAALLLLGIEHDYFARVMSILVYPTGFRSPDGWTRADGVVDLTVGALGQAWYDGPVVLAWDAVVEGGRDPRDGLNVVLHEFAHQLDYLDGVADGTPLLRRKGDYAKWQEVMTREYARLKAEAEHGTPKVLDAYGATDHAEFFAVATEAFFEKPRQMYARHPELYAVLGEYYGQDPAARDRPEGPLPDPEQAEGRKLRRDSRVAAKVEAHAQVAREWPWWIQFWDIHPGVARAQALRPLEHHITYAIGFLAALALPLGISYLDHWRWNAGLLIIPLLSLTMVALAVWLRLAVRWVDRHGKWGGEYRPEEPTDEPEAGEPAPLG